MQPLFKKMHTILSSWNPTPEWPKDVTNLKDAVKTGQILVEDIQKLFPIIHFLSHVEAYGREFRTKDVGILISRFCVRGIGDKLSYYFKSCPFYNSSQTILRVGTIDASSGRIVAVRHAMNSNEMRYHYEYLLNPYNNLKWEHLYNLAYYFGSPFTEVQIRGRSPDRFALIGVRSVGDH